MQLLSGIGLLASWGLFGLTWILSMQNCYNWSCDCSFDIESHHLYLFISLGLSTFFLIYCVVFLFKRNELKSFQKRDETSHTLDGNLIPTHYTIYQLPMIQLLTKVGFGFSIALLGFAFMMNGLSCVPEAGCEAGGCPEDYSYDQELYLLGYGAMGVYFLMLTLVGLLKSYPSKYGV